jgi:hypothetical protein
MKKMKLLICLCLGFSIGVFGNSKENKSIIPKGDVFIINGNASGLTKYGDWLYMVMNESTHPLLVYDISNPAKPRLVRYVPTPGWPVRCRIFGDWLWTVHVNGEGFFHLSDPSNPRFSVIVNEGPNFRRLERVWSKDEWKPEFHGQKFLIENLSRTSCATENTLFYKTLDNKTEIYDIHDPKHPKLLTTIEEGTPVNLTGNLLFIAGANSLNVYNVSDPSNPKKIGVIDLTSFQELKENKISVNTSDVAYNEGKLYILISRPLQNFLGLMPAWFPASEDGIAVLDVKDWNKPVLLGWYIVPNIPASFSTLVYHKGHVFVSDVSFGLRVFDVQEPKNIRQVAADRQGGEVSALAVIPKRKLICVGQNIVGGLVFVDVSNPEKPEVLSYLHLAPFRFWGNMVSYKDRYIYALGDFSSPRPGGRALFVIDTEDPRNPKIVNIISGAQAYGGIVVDHYLYTGSQEVYDLSDPINPKKLDIKLPGGGPVVYREPYLFFGGNPVCIVNIKDREKPQLVGQVSIPWEGHRVKTIALVGNHLFLGWARPTGGARPSGTLVAVDISDPTKPRIDGSWDVREDFGFSEFITYTHVWSDEKYLFVGIYHRWIAMFEVNEQPQLSLKLVSKIGGSPTAWIMTGEPGRIYRLCLDRVRILQY